MRDSVDHSSADRRIGITIIVIILAQLIGVINTTVVATAIPSILDDLGGSPVLGSWLLTIAIVGLAVSTPIWGRLGDVISPTLLLRISLIVTAVTGVFQASAGSLLPIVLSRFVQAVGIGGLLAVSIVVFARIVPPLQRGKYTGWLSTANLVGTMSGPFLGGLLSESPIGWRGAFVLVVPLIIVTLILLQFTPKLEPGQEKAARSRVDILGAILIAVGVSSILVWLSFAGDTFEYTSAIGLALLVIGMVAIALLIVVELRHRSPILPLRELRGRVMALAIIAAAAVGTITIPLALFMSMYLQFGRGVSPAMAGLMLIATAGGNVLAAFVVGVRTTKTGRLRRYLIGGGVFLVAGSVLLAQTGPTTPLWLVIGALFLLGLGQGAVMQFIVLAAQNAVPISQVGAVSGFTQFAQTLGGATTMAVFGGILGGLLVTYESEGMTMADAYAVSIPTLFPVLAIFALIATVAFMLLPPIQLRATIDEAKPEGPDGEAPLDP